MRRKPRPQTGQIVELKSTVKFNSQLPKGKCNNIFLLGGSVVKFKRIAMAFVFLISQMSFAHAAGSAKKVDTFDNLPLSAMILSEESIAQLSDADRTAYIRAIFFLSQVLERSQAQKFEYESPTKYEPTKTSSISEKQNSLFSLYWGLLVNKANAWIGQLAGWVMKGAEYGGARLATGSLKAVELAKTPMKAVGSKISDVGLQRYAKDLVKAEASGIPANVTKVEKNIAGAGLKLSDVKAVASTLGKNSDALKKSIVTQLKDVKALEVQREAARTAGNVAEVKKLNTQIARAESAIVKDKRAFYEAGGSVDEMSAILRKSNTSTGRVILSNVAETILVVGAGYQGGKYVGLWGESQIKLEDRKIRDGMVASEANKNPGKIIREQGYSCIYGGRASTLVKSADGSIFCKLPEGSQNEKCNINNGDFQCPSYGFTVPVGDLEKDLCIKIEPKKDLTLNCMDKFLESINTAGEVVLREGGDAKLLEFNESLRKLLVILEGDTMTDIENKAHSFSYYCANSKKAQKSECNALTAFINTLKDRPEIKKAIVAQAAAAPAAEGAPAAAPTEAPDKARATK